MVRLLLEPRTNGSRVEDHARRLVIEQFEKSNYPMGIAASRAMVPTYCDKCGERCWSTEGALFDYCPKCKGEGNTPVGFGA